MCAEARRFSPSCSVVICTHNRHTQLNQCLSAVRQLDYPRFEIIVVDSAPVDDTARQVAARWNAKYIVEPVVGISRARNRGARLARRKLWPSSMTTPFPSPIGSRS